GERPYIPVYVCPLSWGAFKALRLNPHQKIVIRKKVKFRREDGTLYSLSYARLSLAKVLGGDLYPQTARIKLNPKYLKNQLFILPPRKGRTYSFGFHRGKRRRKVRLTASLKVEGSDGLQQAKVVLQIKPLRWTVGDLMKELKAALGKGDFPLRARLVALEKGTLKMLSFDAKPKIKREKEKILVIWQKKLKKRLSAGSLAWGYVWGSKGVWSRAYWWYPVVSPMEKVKAGEEESQK
ncbi:MAG: hypothetical protein DRP63_00080, partial [Planctomycetota bacterium]